MVRPTERAQVDALIPVVYDRLRALADRYVQRHPSDTLHPTALVHEAWLKLAGHDDFADREHFSAVAARAMRQILVDRARARGRIKRGEAPVRTTISGLAGAEPALDVLDLEQALGELEAVDPRGARVVELRYFGGLTVDEIAVWLDLSPRTVHSTWRRCRAWLVERLTRAD